MAWSGVLVHLLEIEIKQTHVERWSMAHQEDPKQQSETYGVIKADLANSVHVHMYVFLLRPRGNS